MTAMKRSALVAYSAEQMFSLVNDVKSYPEFVPYCTGSEVLSQTPEEVKASLVLGFSGMSKSFTTSNRLFPHKMIEVRLIKGPFKNLEGFWQFEEVDGHACKVSLDLEFEIVGGLVSMIFGPVFQQVAGKLVDAFCQRAETVYAKA
ncbi:MAG: type II toxin-antitoxin system RatA family toxin [Pseudomonadota bacterium]